MIFNLFNTVSNPPPAPTYDDPYASEYGEYRYDGPDYLVSGVRSYE